MHLCDLGEGLGVFITTFSAIRPNVLGPLLADCTGDPELHAEFMAALFDPPRAAVARMLDRATTHGDLRPDIDRELILDMLGSLIHYRTLFGHAPTGDTEVEHAIEALLAGIATHLSAPGATRTHTGRVLSPLPLPNWATGAFLRGVQRRVSLAGCRGVVPAGVPGADVRRAGGQPGTGRGRANRAAEQRVPTGYGLSHPRHCSWVQVAIW